jgi:hypothetical protein
MKLSEAKEILKAAKENEQYELVINDGAVCLVNYPHTLLHWLSLPEQSTIFDTDEVKLTVIDTLVSFLDNNPPKEETLPQSFEELTEYQKHFYYLGYNDCEERLKQEENKLIKGW